MIPRHVVRDRCQSVESSVRTSSGDAVPLPQKESPVNNLPNPQSPISRRTLVRGALTGAAAVAVTSAVTGGGSPASAAALPSVTMTFNNATPTCWVNDVATPYEPWISTTDPYVLGEGTGLKVFRSTANILRDSSTFTNALSPTTRSWQSHSSSTKRVISISDDGAAITFGMKAVTKDPGGYGGFRSVETIEGVVDVTATIGMSNVAAGEVYEAFFAWFDPTNGSFSDPCTVYRTKDEEALTRISMRMNNPRGPRRLVIGIYPNHSEVSLESEPYLSVANLMVTTAEQLPHPRFVDDGTGAPAGWKVYDPNASATLTKFDSTSFTVASKRSTTVPTSFGGLRGTEPFDPQSAVLVQARVALNGVPASSDATVMAGWWDAKTKAVVIKTPLFAASAVRTKPQSPGIDTPSEWPCAATLPAPGGERTLVLFVESRDQSALPGATVEMRVKDLTMTASPMSGWESNYQSPYTKTSWNRTAPSLRCPDGQYTFFAKVRKNVGTSSDTQNEWITAEVDAVGGSGIDLSKALEGSWKVWQVTAIPSTDKAQIAKQIRDLGTPALTNVPNDNPVGALRTARHVMVKSNTQVGSAQPSSIRTALDRNFTNFTLVQGDVAPRDNAVDQRRAEIRSELPLGPYSTPIWTSFSIRLNKQMQRGFCITGQWHCSTDKGDHQHYSPDLSLVLAKHPTGTWAQVTARSDGGVADYSSRSKPPTLIENNIGAPTPLETGAWYHVVISSTFSRSGGGSVRWWLNGVEISDPNAQIPVGYSRVEGLGFMYGAYTSGTNGDVADPETNKVDLDYANVEFGTGDLSARITRPRPVPVA